MLLSVSWFSPTNPFDSCWFVIQVNSQASVKKKPEGKERGESMGENNKQQQNREEQ